MALHTWTAYFLAAILIALSPGSGAVLAMSYGLGYGVRRTRATIAGLQVGLLVILLVAGAGVGSLLVASALAFSVVKTLGASYLIYIGWSQWRSSQGIALDGAAVTTTHKRRPGALFLAGLLTSVTNPRGILSRLAEKRAGREMAKPGLWRPFDGRWRGTVFCQTRSEVAPQN